jgi:hypothetical protein
LLHSNTNFKTIFIHNMDDFHKHYIEWKKQTNDSIYMNFKKKSQVVTVVCTQAYVGTEENPKG